MANEYVTMLGLDGTKFGETISNSIKQTALFNAEMKKAADLAQKNFSEATRATSTMVSETAKAIRSVKEQNTLAKELAGIYATLATAAARANDTAPIKKYAEEFKKLADLASKTQNFNVEFDDADLVLYNGVLERTNGELKELSALLEVLKPKLANLDPNSEEFKLLSEQVSTAESIIKDFNSEFDNTTTKSKSLRTELKDLKQSLALMEEQGKDNTAEFEQMAIRAGELEDQIGDTSARIKVLASDTKYIDATIQAVSALTAGFGLVQGAQALFGTENKELNETLNKLQGVMVVLNSLQEIQNILQKQSALNVLTSRKAHIANTAAIEVETAATEVQTIATTTANTATKGFWATLLANPVGWVLAAVGGLVAILSSLKEKVNLNKLAEEDLNNVRGESLKSIGKEQLELNALLLTAKDETQSKEKRKTAIDAINAKMPEYNNNITIENVNTKAVSDQISTYITQLQKKALAQAYISKIQELYGQLIDAENASLEDNVKWYQTLWNAIKSGGDIQNLAINQAKTAIKNRQENIDSINKEIDALQGKFDADIKSGNAIIDVNNKTTKSNKDAAKTNLQTANSYQQALLGIQMQYRNTTTSLIADDRARSKKELQDRFDDDVQAIKKVLDEQRDAGKLTEQLQIAADNQLLKLKQKLNIDLLKVDAEYYQHQRDLITVANEAIEDITRTETERQIAAATKKFDDLIKPLQDYNNKLISESMLGQKNLSAEELKIIEQNNETIVQLNKTKGQAVNKITEDSKLEQIEQQKQLALETANQLKIAGATEEQLTEAKEVIKLGIIKKYAQESLTEITSSLEKQGKLTKEQIEQLLDPTNMQDAAAAGKDIFSYLGLSDKLDADTKSKILGYIDQINDATDGAQGDTEKKKPKTLFEWLGIKEEFVRLYSDGISKAGEVTSQFFQSMLDGINNQIKAKDNQIDILNQQINEVGDELGRELDLQKAGYSSNVKAKQEELNKLKAQRDQEQKDKEELQKKQAALQKAQIIADTFAQASNLITAASEIFAAFAEIPIVGVPLAIAAIGLMLGSFAVAKVNAYKAAGQVQTFRHGGGKDLKGQLLQGPSHENGGIGLYNDKTGEKLAEYEGGEYLFAINQRSKGEYLPLLEAINADDTEKIRKHSAMIYGAERLPDITDTLNVARKVHAQEIEQQSNSLVKTDLSKLDHLETIAENTKPVERETIIETEEYRLIKAPGRTRKIFKH